MRFRSWLNLPSDMTVNLSPPVLQDVSAPEKTHRRVRRCQRLVGKHLDPVSGQLLEGELRGDLHLVVEGAEAFVRL